MSCSKLSGVGVGLRSCHYPFIETEQPIVPWFEILSDNYFSAGGASLYHLEKICSAYPVTLHGVGLSLGSTDPLNLAYLNKLKTLIKLTKPHLISDHLCWTSFAGEYFHELLPLPYTTEAILHTAERIKKTQDFLQRQIMIENVSSYLNFKHSHMNEWEFLQAVADESDCLILLDINNIYVSAYNNQFDPLDYLRGLSPKRVTQFHLAGFQQYETHLLDTHSTPIHPPVWELFVAALKKFGSLPVSIEWDNNIPDFNHLLQEAKHAEHLMELIKHDAVTL